MTETADPTRLPSILVIGFPKSGTSTLQRAFTASGLTSAHWTWNGTAIGRLIYDGWFDRGDPLALLQGLDAVTQMDFCHPESGRNYWPNLDISLLLAIRRLHPEVRLIFNARPYDATVDSFAHWQGWGALVGRVTRADIPGLPAGRGDRHEDLTRWIEAHHAAIRDIFDYDPNFLDLDITAPDARSRLSSFIGRPLKWWGVENANPPSGEDEENEDDDKAAPAEGSGQSAASNPDAQQNSPAPPDSSAPETPGPENAGTANSGPSDPERVS